MFRVVIPARYGAVRLPGKPLRLIGGKPMIQWVYERARASAAAEVWIATDDERIATACRAFGAPVALTSSAHESGTDRIAEVARQQSWPAQDSIVNVQGDEPLLPPALIDQAAALLEHRPEAGIATLATPIRSHAEFLDPNIVKAVVGADGLALYFSRAPVPWPREDSRRYEGALRHLGLYAYRVHALLAVAACPPSALERREKLEQLRALEHGIKIAVAPVEAAPPPGVDTEEDLARVARHIGADLKGTEP